MVLPLFWLLLNVFEGKKPEISIQLPSVYLTKSYKLALTVADQGTGLRQVQISIIQGTKEKLLVDKKYTFLGYTGFLQDRSVGIAGVLKSAGYGT